MKKRIIIFGILFLILIGIGLYLMQHVEKSYDDDRKRVPSADVEESVVPVPLHQADDHINVVSVEGSAEKKNSTSGQWRTMRKGDLLNVDDSVRTLDDSTVVLGLGETSTIELSHASEIEVRELSGAAQKLGLIKGRASVDYSENGKRVLNIENSDGTVVAKVDEGKFSILNNGQLVAVATETGSVDLSAGGESVTVSKGMESVVEKGKAPVTPYQISANAYLKLSGGACRKQTNGMAIVRGTVSVGTEIRIENVKVQANPDGSFMARIKLAENHKKVQLKTTDVWGNIKERTVICTEPRNSASIKNVVIDWGKKGE